MERLKKGGCKDLILVVSPENKDAVAALHPAIPLVVQKGTQLGMHRAFLEALPLCKDEPVLLVSGNDFIDPSAFAMLRNEAAKPGAAGALLARTVESYFPGGYLTAKNGRVTGIVEKPGAGKEPSGLVNIVAHIHNDASLLLRALQRMTDETDDVYERALHGLLRDHEYRAVPYDGPWQAVKYPWHLLHLLPLLLADIQKPAIHRSAKIHGTAVVEGNVVIEENVRILPHATIAGPCFIGAGSIVGNNALIRGASVGPGCVIGYGCEVKSSVLAGPVWAHMTYLGDSVIGENVSFGGGCMTGNLRLDEGEISSACDGATIPTGLTKLGMIVGNDCRFGIQVGSNPGVKAGTNCFVGGGVFLQEDVPDGSFVSLKEGKLHLRPNRAKAPSMEERKRYMR